MAEGAIGLGAASDFLERRYGGRVTGVEPLTGGDWSRAFAFRLAGEDRVVRFGAWREDFERDRLATSFASTRLPVPRLFEIGEALGAWYAVSERHFGTFLEALDAASFRRVLPAVLDALDAMRELDPPERPGGTWESRLLDALVDRPGGRVSGWRRELAASASLDALFLAGTRALEGLLPRCPDLSHVLHLDLLNRNVLCADDGSRLEAVFDWGCLAYGDFVYEVAWFTFWSPWHPSLAAAGLRRAMFDHYASLGLAVDALEERLACYEVHVGLTHLAYCAFAGRGDDLRQVADRLTEILEARARL